MIHSKQVNKACNVMYDAHKDDIDKGGYPYVFHPFYLATQMDDEDSTWVALLHDVVEDHGDIYSFETLNKMGFNSNIINALKLLTHDENVPYMEYVQKIKTNPLARKVKIADLKHNLDTTRTGNYPRKYELYKEALACLETNNTNEVK